MKYIKLTQNKFAMVDNEDFEYLGRFKWSYNNGYAVRHQLKNEYKDGPRRMVKMHTVVNKTPEDRFTDHISGETLDNRKSNLRIADAKNNGANRKTNKNSYSGFKGVTIFNNKWRAAIRVNGEYIFLGYFNNKIEAARAYNQKAKEAFGKYGRLNNV